MTIGVCQMRDCPTKVTPDKLFCSEHYALVPTDIRERIIYWSYKRRYAIDQADARQLRRNYADAVREAKAAINQRRRAS